jgi:CheY-like chemotaxis protein
MATVLLIDDERLPMSYYARALEKEGFAVKQFYDPDAVFDFIEHKNPRVDAIILDIMMLPGKRYENENTNEGLATGTYLYKDLRQQYPDVPFIVLTNVSHQQTLMRFQEEPDLTVAQKLDYPPFELARLVSGKVNAANASAVSSTVRPPTTDV